MSTHTEDETVETSVRNFFNPFFVFRVPCKLQNWHISVPMLIQIDSSTIDGNVEFVHSQYSCILSSQVSIQFLCPTKSSVILIILE